MRRGPRLLAPALALAGLAATLLQAAASAGAPGLYPEPIRRSSVRIVDRFPNRIVVTAPAYRLTLAKANGAVLQLVDRAAGARLVIGQNGCLWGATQAGESSYVGGCAYDPHGANRFSYRLDRAARTLTFTYEAPADAARGADAVVVLTAREQFFDVRLKLANRRRRVIDQVVFPADLFVDASRVEAGYAPNFLPGIRLKPAFFSRLGHNVRTYPSRWAFADYLALDAAGGHLAVYSANPPPNPIAPVDLGFIHNGTPVPCSGSSFCITHAFQTWIEDGATWTSPAVRVLVGEPVEESILAYRRDSGIEAYPSLEAKLGGRLDALARAPLIKADLRKGLPPFEEWGPELARLPSPALVHPVAFQPGGHDESDPDFLPPERRFGTTESMREAVGDAHSLGQLVMPYLNLSWWDDGSRTVRSLPPPLTLADIAVQDSARRPAAEGYGGHNGYLVSPYHPFVRDRAARLMEEWRTEVPVDCLFFDQIGARPWRRDFNPAAPTPLAYGDGWLGVLAPYANRCLMVEDGWDRLAGPFVGFHGGLLLMHREHDYLDTFWGEGNWEPYPLALWLFHDKVLLYQHDLYEGTMTVDPEVLTFNMAFGFVLSYNWDGDAGTLGSPWLPLVGSVQRALGPHYAGRALTSYRAVAPDVTETAFGDFVVTANWSRTRSYDAGGLAVAPGGFLARTADGSVVTGAFRGTFNGAPLTEGVHYLILERGGAAVTVSQPLGGDTEVAVDPPASWRPGGGLRARALDKGGQPFADVAGRLRGGRFEFRYESAVDGRPAAGYRITLG